MFLTNVTIVTILIHYAEELPLRMLYLCNR